MALPAGSFGQVRSPSMFDQRSEAERWALIIVPAIAIIGLMFWSGRRKHAVRGLGALGHGGCGCGPSCGCGPCRRRWG